jgi:hypothetical protein
MRQVLPVVVLAVCGCQPPDPDATLQRFALRVRSSVTPAEVDTWASSVSTNSVGTILRSSDLPEWARRLPDSPVAQILTDTKTGDKVVTLMAGGGFGMWGMVVGPRSYQSGLGTVREHWTNGIWFCR